MLARMLASKRVDCEIPYWLKRGTNERFFIREARKETISANSGFKLLQARFGS